MIKNIIFDWSGVIKDSVESQLWIVNRIFLEFGAREITLNEFKDNWEQPYMLFYKKYLPSITFEEEQIAYRKNIMACPQPKSYLGIISIIKEWQKKGVKMMVVSSDFPETLLSEIISFGLKDVFMDVLTEVYDKKSAMERLIKKYNFARSETIVIGDSNQEIESGKEVGIKTVAVTWGFCKEEKLVALKPDFIIRDLAELKLIIN